MLSLLLHTYKSFRNLLKSNLNQIVFIIFRLIWHQMEFRSVEKINHKIVNTIRFWFDRTRVSTWPLRTLRKLCFHFLSYWLGYDRGDSFPFNFEPSDISFGSEYDCGYSFPLDFEPYWISFCSKSKGKLSQRSYPI